MELHTIGTHVHLMIEKDSGNEILVLFGKPVVAIKDWERLRNLCDEAIQILCDEIEYQKAGGQATYHQESINKEGI